MIKPYSIQHRHLTLFIIVCSVIAFIPLLKNGFVAWDDMDYVVNNPLIQIISFTNIRYIFSNYFLGNYHPFALLSLAIDYQLFGLNPAGYHFHNFLLHLINSILIYYLFYQLFKGKIIAFFVAFLFCIHPLHVESVAWISERKDLLYVFYYLLSLLTD